MVLVAFAGDPKVKSIEASSETVKPGETLEMQVTFKGKATSIKNVEMITREFPYDAPPIIFSPEGDNKKVWKISFPIPYEAPPGKYHLELKVTLEDGSVIVSGDTEDQAYGKSGLMVITVN